VFLFSALLLFVLISHCYVFVLFRFLFILVD
jgi:hypothetical protein